MSPFFKISGSVLAIAVFWLVIAGLLALRFWPTVVHAAKGWVIFIAVGTSLYIRGEAFSERAWPTWPSRVLAVHPSSGFRIFVDVILVVAVLLRGVLLVSTHLTGSNAVQLSIQRQAARGLERQPFQFGMLQMFEYPFRLRSTSKGFEVIPEISVRPIEPNDRQALLGIKDVTLDDQGRLKSFSTVSRESSERLVGPNGDDFDQLYASNFVLSAPTYEKARIFTLVLKLMAPSCSALFVGKNRKGATQYISPPSYLGQDPLTIRYEDIPRMKLICQQVTDRWTDTKLKLMAPMYLYATSRHLRRETRFMELSVVLEMLLLPKASTELSYRFALRYSRLLHLLDGTDLDEAFAVGRLIYRVRSGVVHSGAHDDIDEAMDACLRGVRRLLEKYVEDPIVFADANLDRLCLHGSGR